ncbi:cytidine deaminase-like protein [Coccomyxa subellipsoidea C-169]|uniref:Cytidine deaminase-like protein n=1 Tax=Coccomyxa subellipsoidea (strain C-169) TaxID=574566 RepID=I0YQH4_COCSC|nr:cytidine deaminase-like protein [Coccomyxa subellipsoidea C-169]EIE20643.1 cytidine deaminase-like protein [Coccomyxa subellipsoidea C-169]|eukprot:XP_005645187.1 cytidine deaminase-like protein [Coccomyxa subellipsoidea C-169]
MLEPDQAAELQAKHSVTLHELMQLLVAPAALLARPPTSAFPVGAIGLGVSGRIYVGVNLEFPNLPLQHSVHAEQFLVANAAACGERGLTRITVNAAPCGHCRQFLAETVTAESMDIVYKGNCYRLDDILVDKFCPSDLIEPGTAPLLLEQQHNAEAAEAAVKAAMESYAPYTRCPAGLALVTNSGRIYGGGVIESCAYNPTLNPLQSAYIAFAAAGEASFFQVCAAVLVELPEAAVSHEVSTRIALQCIAPGAEMVTLPLKLLPQQP